MKQNYRWIRSEWLWILFMAVVTTILGEVKLVPFSNDENFRFALGSIVFLFFLLMRPLKSVLFTGFITGVVTIGFRMSIDVMQHGNVGDALLENYPAFFYYMAYACGFHFLQLRRFINQPFKLGVFAAIVEFFSNSTEHMIRFFFLPNVPLSIEDFGLVAGVAIFRSFFVVGIYSTIILAEQKKYIEEQLTMDSDLYMEAMYLQKSMNHIEQIMADSYDLYRQLKVQDRQLGIRALHIAQEIHEVKKDSQRIFASISSMTMDKTNEYYVLSDILQLVKAGNEKYSDLLGKKVLFHVEQSEDFQIYQPIPLLAIFNNLVANAVEAIESAGVIHIRATKQQTKLVVDIEDDGPGIPRDDLAIIFEPGYTTKFNDNGVAATGIGLSHVQEVIRKLDGDITVASFERGTVFHIELPLHAVLQKGEL